MVVPVFGDNDYTSPKNPSMVSMSLRTILLPLITGILVALPLSTADVHHECGDSVGRACIMLISYPSLVPFLAPGNQYGYQGVGWGLTFTGHVYAKFDWRSAGAGLPAIFDCEVYIGMPQSCTATQGSFLCAAQGCEEPGIMVVLGGSDPIQLEMITTFGTGQWGACFSGPTSAHGTETIHYPAGHPSTNCPEQVAYSNQAIPLEDLIKGQSAGLLFVHTDEANYVIAPLGLVVAPGAGPASGLNDAWLDTNAPAGSLDQA